MEKKIFKLMSQFFHDSKVLSYQNMQIRLSDDPPLHYGIMNKAEATL